MKWIASLFAGTVLGTASVLLHAAKVPFGLTLSLIGTGTGIWIIGRQFGKRLFKILAGVGWVAIVLNAAAPGVGDELLVQGNFAGSGLVLGGIVVLVMTILIRV